MITTVGDKLLFTNDPPISVSLCSTSVLTTLEFVSTQGAV